jgi:hypothetical protein
METLFFGQQKLFIMGSQIIFWAARLIICPAKLVNGQQLASKAKFGQNPNVGSCNLNPFIRVLFQKLHKD